MGGPPGSRGTPGRGPGVPPSSADGRSRRLARAEPGDFFQQPGGGLRPGRGRPLPPGLVARAVPAQGPAPRAPRMVICHALDAWLTRAHMGEPMPRGFFRRSRWWRKGRFARASWASGRPLGWRHCTAGFWNARPSFVERLFGAVDIVGFLSRLLHPLSTLAGVLQLETCVPSKCQSLCHPSHQKDLVRGVSTLLSQNWMPPFAAVRL